MVSRLSVVLFLILLVSRSRAFMDGSRIFTRGSTFPVFQRSTQCAPSGQGRGSVGLMNLQTDASLVRNFSALDGFMEHGLYASSYDAMTDTYAQNAGQWRRVIRPN